MSKCRGHNHPPGCTCGYNPIYVDGQRHDASLLHYSKAKQQMVGHTLSLMLHRSASSINRGCNCRYCGKLVYYVEHNDGKVFFDELGYPWPIHDCMGHRGATARQRFKFGSISLTAALQPVLCRIKSWIKRDEHLFAHLDTIENIPQGLYVKLMSKRIGIKRDSIIVLFHRNSICTLANTKGEESQVRDCDKSWYENELRKMLGNQAASQFLEMIAGSEECLVKNKKVEDPRADVSENCKEKTFVATCTGSDEWYFYFKLIKGPSILQCSNLVIRVKRKSKITKNAILEFQGKIPKEVTLKIQGFSHKKARCTAEFVQFKAREGRKPKRRRNLT